MVYDKHETSRKRRYSVFFEDVEEVSDSLLDRRDKRRGQSKEDDKRTPCEKCGLFESCISPKICLSGYGINDIVFVGDAPGELEDKKGKAFIGAGGKLLRRTLDKFGLLHQSSFTTVVRCKPVSSSPSNAQIRYCGDQFLLQELQEVKPKLVVLLGDVAVKYFFGNKSVEAMRYKILKLEGLNFMCTVHPTQVLRNANLKSTYQIDFAKMKYYLDSYEKQEYFKYQFLKEPERVREYLSYLTTVEKFGFDYETIGVSPYKEDGGIVSASFYEGCRLPTVIYWKDLLKELPLFKDLMQSPVKKIMDNGKYEALHSWARGSVRIKNFSFDPMIAAYLLDETNSWERLEVMAWQYLPNVLGWKYLAEEWITQMDKCPEPILGEYSAKDAKYTYQLEEVMSKLLEKERVESLMPFLCKSYVSFAFMEHKGVKIDRKYLETAMVDVERDMNTLRDKFLEFTKLHGFEEFNLNSPIQLKSLFFDKLKLPVLAKTKPSKKFPKGQPALDKDVLPKYEKKHPVIGVLVEYRRYQKVLSTYLTGLHKNLSIEDIIHTSFHLVKTKTGRTSSSKPMNLQNIPRTHNDIKWSGINPYATVKRCFISRYKGGKILELDYSQLELRVLAMVSQDRALKQAFIDGKDIHGEVASQFSGNDSPTEEDRNKAKGINFGIPYGSGPQTIAENLDCSYSEAETYINKWFERFPEAKRWIEETKVFLRTYGYVRSVTQRKRRIPKIWSRDEYKRAAAEREGVNAKIQGPASDILITAMNEIVDLFMEKKLQSFPIIPVHDSLLFDTHPDEFDYVKDNAKRIMESVDLLFINVPLVVKMKWGYNWKDMEDI